MAEKTIKLRRREGLHMAGLTEVTLYRASKSIGDTTHWWQGRLLDSNSLSSSVRLRSDEWEEVPPPFTFPTKSLAVIALHDDVGPLASYTRIGHGGWRNNITGHVDAERDLPTDADRWRIVFPGED